ncbi:MAG: hypothetical protein IGS48_19380 [Oscillatoriales cyanobacterium C42_A2020_001]|nr:hypothetical protein [Leptolyngbyaceae cyanobacterium C42_A2020_001]
MNQINQVSNHWLGTSLAVVILLGAADTGVQAQLPSAQSFPAQEANSIACPPPQPSEFLLLVVTRTPDSQGQVRQLLPPNTAIATCNYLNDQVTRVGGFRTVERANAWARYITETTGLAAYVARPAEAPVIAPPPSPASKPATPSTPPSPGGKPTTTSSSQYNPKPLGPGYAVLVDYANQPEIAITVKQAIGRDVGLVAYGQSPFLLALYTTDSDAAYAALQTLSDRGFWATLVDSRRVVLLKQTVALPKSVSNQPSPQVTSP